MIGPFAWRSVWNAFHGSSNHFINLLLTDSRLLGNVAVESALLAALLWFLHRRGWKTSDFKIKPGVQSTAEGVALSIAVLFANFATVVTLFVITFHLQTTYHSLYAFLLEKNPPPKIHSIHAGWTILTATMILNAFFEEITCMGYIFNRFAARHGPGLALILTVGLRMVCHAYQGPVHMLGIGAVFILFGLWYWRTRNLWPLIVGHTLLDMFSTGVMKLLYG